MTNGNSKMALLTLIVLGVWMPDANVPTAGDFHGCTAESASGDVVLNTLKDRVAPVVVAEQVTVASVTALPVPSVLTSLPRAKWPQADLSIVDFREKRGISVEGYLLQVQRRGIEEWNCLSSRWSDVRLWIGAAPDTSAVSGIAAVISPRWGEANPPWAVPELQKLVGSHTLIRITGWPLYDDDEAVDLLRGRKSLWELHPITMIQLNRNGGWIELGK